MKVACSRPQNMPPTVAEHAHRRAELRQVSGDGESGLGHSQASWGLFAHPLPCLPDIS